MQVSDGEIAAARLRLGEVRGPRNGVDADPARAGTGRLGDASRAAAGRDAGGGWTNCRSATACASAAARTCGRRSRCASTGSLQRRVTLTDVATRGGRRHRDGHPLPPRRAGRGTARSWRAAGRAVRGGTWRHSTVMHNKRRPIRIPNVVDERLAAFLGYLIGDGHISEVKRDIGLTTGDEAQADHFAAADRGTVRDRAAQEVGRDRSGACCSAPATSQDFLKHLGLKTGVCARVKDSPGRHPALAEVRRGRVPARLLRLRRLRRQAGRHPVHVQRRDEQDGPAAAAQLRHPVHAPAAQGRLLARPHAGQVRRPSS